MKNHFYLIVLFGLFVSCKTNRVETSEIDKTLYSSPNKFKYEVKKVEIIKKNGEKVIVEAEIADTVEKRIRGLMFRKHLPENRGMLFLMPTEQIQYFYMKNTLIPLDMIFINSNFEIVGIVENTTPMNENNIFVNTPSKYVLEVNAHFCRNHGIKKGDKIKIVE